MTKPGRPSSRKAILAAAAHLLSEVGAGHLTLEGVAQRAGVSKGGLLYNFPTKNALLAAMIEEHLSWATEMFQQIEGGPDTGLWDAVHHNFGIRLGWLCNAATDRTGHSMLAAVAEQPELLEPVRKLHRAFWEMIKEVAPDPCRLWLLWLVTEGLIFSELLNLSPLSSKERAAILNELRAELQAAEAVQIPEAQAAHAVT